MSYYSSFIFELDHPKVDPVQIKAMEEKFANEEKIGSNTKSGVYGFLEVKLPVDENNELIDIDLDDYCAKFYDEKYFAEELSKCLIGGSVSLKFKGEDDESWAYLVTSKKVEDFMSVYMTTSTFADFSRWLTANNKKELL